jgi:HlyD family secretion protein
VYFRNYIPQTGTVEPSRTVYLDAVEGGTIKRIVAESGAMLKTGRCYSGTEAILISELTVLQQEASFNESINRARETRLNIMKNDLDQRQTIGNDSKSACISYRSSVYARQKQLWEKKLDCYARV